MDIQSLFDGPNDSETLKKPRNKSTKRIFIAATRMNDGKTTTSLGLYSAATMEKENGYKTGWTEICGC